MISDFIKFGACVYENSRQVMDINTSDAVKIVQASICHAIDGLNPATIHCSTGPIIKKEGTAKNNFLKVLKL